MEKRGLRRREKALDRAGELGSLHENGIDDLLRRRVGTKDELIAQVIRRTSGSRKSIPSNRLVRWLSQDEDRAVLLVRTGSREWREAGQDELFAGNRAAQDVAAWLSTARYDAPDRLSEIVDAVDADSFQELVRNRRDGDGGSRSSGDHVLKNTTGVRLVRA